MRRSLATELATILEHEVHHADEYHSTEQIMEEGARVINESL